MLLGLPTRYGAGVELYGDRLDFHSLWETVHHLMGEEAPVPHELGEFVLGLAYQLRHAGDGHRERKRFVANGRRVEYVGFKVLWPEILFQFRMLRQAASQTPTTARHQADLYALWSAITEALQQADGQTATQCLGLVDLFPNFSESYDVSMVTAVGRRYVSETPNGKRRIKSLPAYLRMLIPSSEEYTEYQRAPVEAMDREERARAWLGLDWPPFKW